MYARVPDILAASATRYPDRLCVSASGVTYTFAQVDERAGRLAAALIESGLQRGDRVALLALNEPEFFEMQVACQRIGAVFAPLNYRLAAREVREVLADCEPKLLVTGPDCHQLAPASGWPVWRIRPDSDSKPGEKYEDWLRAATPLLRDGMVPGEDLALLLYTSGTFGRARGTMVTNAALFSRVQSYALDLGLTADHQLVQSLPLFHLAGTFNCAFALVGAANHLIRKFDPSEALALLRGTRASHFMGVPTIIDAMLSVPGEAAELEAILYGASPMPVPLLTAAIDRFRCRFFQLYGLTEAGAASLLLPDDHDPQHHPHRLASVGQDIIGFETRILDEEGRACPIEGLGEIVIRGPGQMLGYWRDDAGTQATIRDGWVHTGDIGRRDGDGRLYIAGRIKDMIISGGENVYALEVERCLTLHQAVLECAVIGVPDPHWGERVHAVVVLRPGTSLSLEEVASFCRGHLASYKCPRSMQLMSALPRNAMGKIQKPELRNVATGPVNA